MKSENMWMLQLLLNSKHKELKIVVVSKLGRHKFDMSRTLIVVQVLQL
jgi:hypothetical protein